MADGALLVADDLLPQEKWVETQPERVARLRRDIWTEPSVFPTLVDWSTGVPVMFVCPVNAPVAGLSVKPAGKLPDKTE